MDRNGFDQRSYPKQYGAVKAPRTDSSKPAPDPRYQGSAGRMEDGRGLTDYRSQCEENIPAGSQFATKHWLQNNADSIMSLSRDMQMQRTGAVYGVRMDLEPRAAQEIKCDAYGCWNVDGSETGIGLERLEGVPPLFGTFEPGIGANGPRFTQPKLTKKFEGGRNSTRGGSTRNAVGIDDKLPWEKY